MTKQLTVELYNLKVLSNGHNQNFVFLNEDQLKNDRSKARPGLKFRESFNAAKKRAGLLDIHMHDLRHTAASHLIMSGVNIRTLADILGHRTLQVALQEIIAWLAVSRSKFYAWIKRYGKTNEHNGLIPRDFWLEPWERAASVNFAVNNPLEGYRRLTFRISLPSAPTAPDAFLAKRDCCRNGIARKASKSPVLCNRSGPMTIGMWIFPISTFAAHFIICAAFSMDAVASLSTGRSGNI